MSKRIARVARDERVYCTARRRNGEPCRNAPMLGSSVCRMHGGAAPQVKRAAQMRILQASDKAAARLVEMMQDKTIPPAIQLAAARDLLDRAGLVGKQEIELDVRLQKFEQVALDILVDVDGDDELGEVDDNVIDAEVVDEEAFDEEVRQRDMLRSRRRMRGKTVADLPSVAQARSKR
jgi:hypothetical protein